MKAILYKVSGGIVEDAIERGDKGEIKSIIIQKEKAISNALENASFCRDIGDVHFAAEEEQRARRLTKDLEKLRKAIL